MNRLFAAIWAGVVAVFAATNGFAQSNDVPAATQDVVRSLTQASWQSLEDGS